MTIWAMCALFPNYFSINLAKKRAIHSPSTNCKLFQENHFFENSCWKNEGLLNNSNSKITQSTNRQLLREYLFFLFQKKKQAPAQQ